MASRIFGFCIILVLVGTFCGRSMAQSGCTSTLTSLAPCLNYITGNSANPSSSCCAQLGSVVQSSPQCLCSVLNGSGLPALGITINQTLALSLPGACNVQTPPISQCKAATSPTSSVVPPVSSPASSPAEQSNETPEGAITPSASTIPSASGGSGSGSKTVPSATGSSDATLIKAPLHLILFAVILAFTKF